MILKYFAALLICEVCLLTSGSKTIDCYLEWKSTGTGGRLPENLVEIHGKNKYAARGKDLDEKYTVGSYDAQRNVAFFPFENGNSTATMLASFDLLTNPHGCTLALPQHKDGQIPSNSVKVDRFSPDSTYVGRALFDDMWYAGVIDVQLQGISIAVDGETEFKRNYQVLTSTSDGLFLSVSEFVFENEPFGNELDYMGIDEIRNNGDGTITQTIRHSNKIKEVTTVQLFKNESTSESTSKAGVTILGSGIERTAEHTYKESVEEEMTTIKETELNLVYEIEIPPRSVVTACTTIAVNKNVSEIYTAKGVYSAPSLNATEVNAMLKTENITATIVGNEVIVNIGGKFSGTMASNTQFVAVSSTEGNPVGCYVQQQKLFKEKREKHMKLLSESK